MRPLIAIALALALVPTAAAEFGQESEDGWSMSVDGEVIYPPVAGASIVDVSGVGTAEPLNKPAGLTFYPYYPLLTAEVRRLASDHPDLVKLTSAGKSTLGLDMWLLEIADFARIEAGEGIPLEEREVLYLDGGTHSNEYSGVYFVTEWAQFLLDEYETNETAKWIVENRHTWILPMVNPDGSHAFGRMNAKWVNVNRNFPASWGATEEDVALNNPGPEPGSEAETKVVIALMDKIQPDYTNSIHCCAQLFLHPWGAEEIPPAADLQMFTRVCDEAFAGELRDACGPIWSTIYPASGTTADEGYGRVGASSWTYEMSGRGALVGWGQPVIAADPREQEKESWAGVLHAFLNVEKYGAHPRIVAVAGTPGALDVTVVNDGYGDLTGGTLRVAGRSVALPPLGPDESAVLRVDGAFSARVEPMTLDYVKRIQHAPTATTPIDVALVSEGGRLVGRLGADAIAPLGADVSASVSAPGALTALLAIGAALVMARRR